MLVLLSPAKNLNLETYERTLKGTTPRLQSETKTLAKVAKKLSASDLKALMKISDSLAAQNHDRFQNFKLKPGPGIGKPAALTFAGDVYRGLDADSLSHDDLEWAQNHLRILSGLYGVLRPLDRIQPYRLEMGRNLAVDSAKSLYEFWGNKITKCLNKDIQKHNTEIVLNLASNEYFSALQEKDINARIIHVQFKEIHKDKTTSPMFYTKQARGTLARYIIDKRVENLDDVCLFNQDRYRLDEKKTKTNLLVFCRKSQKS